MPRVVLATGVEQLDSLLSAELGRHGVECAGECYYLEGVLPYCLQKRADTVIISPELPGTAIFTDCLLSLRKSEADIRVILLPGPIDLAGPLELARSVFWTGIYDYVFSSPSTKGSKVNVDEVVARLLAPATFAEAEAALTAGGMAAPNSKTLLGTPGRGHGINHGRLARFEAFNAIPAVDQVKKQKGRSPDDPAVPAGCRNPGVIAVYSPTTDCGKTLIAVGLAEALAWRGVRTVLLDLDLAAGDAARVFRLDDNAAATRPTVTTWHENPSFPEGCLRSKAGVYILPRPHRYAGEADALSLILPGLTSQFEMAVADLGVDYRPHHWKRIVGEASARLLVSDCDHKALFRIGAFLYSQELAWTLVVNLRESRSSISPAAVIKIISNTGLIRESLIIPHIARVEKMNPATFKPDSNIANDLVRRMLSSSLSMGGTGYEKGGRHFSGD